MKLETAPQDVRVNGNFATSDFAIGDVAFIVDMFADKVYTNKELAVVRELSCNAHDSHTMAGTESVPFKVHLPTHLEPFFSIRDYGTGLCEQDIRSVFAGIGISTKRTNNNLIGCFGIGSLSPYALTDSFTVKSYFNGVASTYTCYRDESRKPVVALLCQENTSDPNGLEISLSVDGRVDQFSEAAVDAFKFWSGTIPEINDKEVLNNIKQWQTKFTLKGEDFGFSGNRGSMYAVMGNIAYKIPEQMESFQCEGYLKFDLGELEFDTARENLSITDKVKLAIKNKTKKIQSEINSITVAQIESQPTPYKRALMAQKLSGGVFGRHVKTAGFTKYFLPELKESFVYWQKKWRGVDRGTSKAVPIGDEVQYFIDKPRMQGRIRQFVASLPNNRGTVVIFNSYEQAVESCIDLDLIQDLENLPKVDRAPRTASGNTRKFPTSVFCGGSHYKSSDYWKDYSIDLDSEDDIIYVNIHRNEIESENGVVDNRSLSRMQEDLFSIGVKIPKVIGITRAFAKTDDFKNGNFTHYGDYLRDELLARMPLCVHVFDDGSLNKLRQMFKEGIVNAELTDIINFADSISKSDHKIITMFDKYNIEVPSGVGEHSVSTDNTLQTMMDNFMEKYSMLNLIDIYDTRRNKDIVNKYLNSNCGG